MALNPVPLSGQTLNATRQPIANNFTAINDGFLVDHVELSVPQAGDAGRHKKVTLTQHSNASGDRPAVTTNGFVLYDAIPNVANDARFPITLATPEINVIRDGTNIIIPFTASDQVDEGWTYLPSGLLIKWGYVVGSGARDATQPAHSFPTDAAIPVFSTILHVSITSTNRISNVVTAAARQFTALQVFTTTAITVRTDGATAATGTATDWTYIAMGIGPV